jgi:hypothetical protein
MAEKSSFITAAEQGLSPVMQQAADIDPQLRRIEAEGGTIDIDVYTADKIEKAVFCSIRMQDTGVVEETALVWPDDEHCFPVLWCNLTIVPGVMNVPICDFIPLMDPVVWPGYADTYIEPLTELKPKGIELFGDELVDKAVDLPSKTVYSLSPYKMIVNLSDTGIERVPEVIGEYIKTYIDLWEKAQPLASEDERSHYRRKKDSTRVLMKGNDPGYPFMISVFGEEKTGKVFDIVF